MQSRRMFITGLGSLLSSTTVSGFFPNKAKAQEIITQSIVPQEAKEWFPFLGEEDLSYPMLTTPKYHISVWTKGFNLTAGNRYQFANYYAKRNGRTKKPRTVVYLNSKGASQLDDQFVVLANQIMDDVDSNDTFILRRIDEEYERIWNIWYNCPKYRWVAQSFKPETLRIELKAIPWWISELGIWAAGQQQDTNISILVIGADNLGQPENASLRIFDALAGWEIGNAFGARARWPYTGIQNEIGDQDPCSFTPKSLDSSVPMSLHLANGRINNPAYIK